MYDDSLSGLHKLFFSALILGALILGYIHLPDTVNCEPTIQPNLWMDCLADVGDTINGDDGFINKLQSPINDVPSEFIQ